MRASIVQLLSLLLALVTVPVAAQQFPSQQRGLSADTAFQIGAVDHVNLFNGALTLTIPLGQTYPVGPTLSYGLTLSYSSNGWDYEEADCFDQGMSVDYFIPNESLHTNAGFGWRVVPGKVITVDDLPVAQPARYIGPDGSERGFYPELHPGYPASPSNEVLFSNDSTYLRLRRYLASAGVCTFAPGSFSNGCWQLEFPNGTVHEFHNFTPSDGEETEWILTRMMDRFEHNHWVSFNYATASQWNITDSHGRSHQVLFSGGRITSVRMAAFDNTTAITTLTHTSTPIERHNFVRPDCDTTTDPLTVPLLTRLVLADGSYYEMSYETQSSSVQLSGGIESLRLPTGGEFKWTYGEIDFLSQEPTINGAEYATAAWGIESKALYTEAGNPASLKGAWTYDYVTVGNPSMPGDTGPCFHTVTVTDTNGNDTVHYFDSASLNRWQYGLPYRRCDLVTGAVLAPPYPSQEIWDGSAGTGTLLRTVYVEYGSDGRDGGLHQERNHRLKLRRVEYQDDAGRFQQTESSDFDGLGHFRQTVTTGNLAGPQDRTTLTTYNADNGTLILNPDDSSPQGGNDFVMPPISDPWVLETFTERQVTENGDTAKSQFCFDETTGFLERTRVLRGASPAPTDVLRVFEEETIGSNGTGRVAVENTYGGDEPGGLPGGNLCTLNLPAESQHKVAHTYASGVLQTSKVLDPCDDNEILILADHQVIDSNTGLVRRSHDSAGVSTVFLYDVLGRPTVVRPEMSASTVTDYELPTLANLDLAPTVKVVECPMGSNSCGPSQELSWQLSTFDGLGRLVREGREVLTAGGVTPIARDFTYNAMGWKTGETLWGTTRTTTFSHDRFGRVVEIDPADTSLAKTLFVYAGDRQIERTESVATLPGEEDDRQRICRREHYDAFGRLVRVAEDLASNGLGDCSAATGLVTNYSYDESDRLVHVCSRGNTSGCVQQRFFNYDNRGFLNSEQHPEIGPVGNGQATYTYDPSGNVLRKDVAGSDDFSLKYRYDPANRLIAVDEIVQDFPRSTRPLKRFQYARSNLDSDDRAGKLVAATRINWVDPVGPLFGSVGNVPVAVTQSYRYGGRDGRVSARQTRVQFGSEHYAFLTGFTWDPQGNLGQLIYPRCLHSPCVGTDPQRDVDFDYEGGFLERVQGYATSLSYQLGGMLRQVVHSNGVTETIETKPTFPMQRPHRISTSDVAGGNNWSTGVYQYDGASNVKVIGNQLFQYDRMSRLLMGEVPVGAGEKTQHIQYDNFGNITSLTTDGATLSTPTSITTNRLTSGTYDAGGNLTNITLDGTSYQYTYDPLNMMKHLQSDSGQARVFAYDANDERIMTFDCAFVDGECGTPEQSTTTIRGLDNQVLRVYKHLFDEGWNWERDYVYRDGQMLASVEPDGNGEKTLHFHLDHLGSPRQITDENAVEVARHSYYPFGGEATDPSQNDVRLKFTGHERDPDDGIGLDYMHARFCSPSIGRFLSTDPLDGGFLETPQSWNEYTYALNNPATVVDPSGEVPILYLAALIAAGGAVFGPSVANAPESPETELIPSEQLPLDVLTAEAAMGPLGHFLGGLFNKLFGRLFRSGVPKVAAESAESVASVSAAAGASVTVSRKATRLHLGQQGKHIHGHNNYIPGRSPFTHSDPQGLLSRFAGKGQAVNNKVPRGQPGFRERVDFGEVIGEVNGQPTTKGIIHYSKNGAHIVLANP